MAFFSGTGRHWVQITQFFRGQIGSRTRSGIGLGPGSRLDRMRRFLGLPRELWIENFGGSWYRSTDCRRRGRPLSRGLRARIDACPTSIAEVIPLQRAKHARQATERYGATATAYGAMTHACPRPACARSRGATTIVLIRNTGVAPVAIDVDASLTGPYNKCAMRGILYRARGGGSRPPLPPPTPARGTPEWGVSDSPPPPTLWYPPPRLR